MSKRKYDVDFKPMGQAIKVSREAAKITREAGAEMVDISTRHLQSIELEGQPRRRRWRSMSLQP